MKFRAKIIETLSMRSLAAIGSTLSKLSRSCVLKVCPTKMSFFVYEDTASFKEAKTWCTINALQFFNEFTVEGVTETNDIFLDLPTDMLSSSLSQLKGGSSVNLVKLKLTDKLSPCLTVEMEFASDYGASRFCVHDIPVKLISRSQWCLFTEPPEKNYSLSLEMSSVKKLKAVVEKLKKFFQHVEIGGSGEGTFFVFGQTPTASVKTTFKNIPVLQCSEGEMTSTVRVNVKKLHQLLLCENLSPRRTIFDFVQDLVHVQVQCDHFTMHFSLAAMDE